MWLRTFKVPPHAWLPLSQVCWAQAPGACLEASHYLPTPRLCLPTAHVKGGAWGGGGTHPQEGVQGAVLHVLSHNHCQAAWGGDGSW